MNAIYSPTTSNDAPEYTGHAGTATFYRNDHRDGALYEIEFLDGQVILAAESDLTWL